MFLTSLTTFYYQKFINSLLIITSNLVLETFYVLRLTPVLWTLQVSTETHLRVTCYKDYTQFKGILLTNSRLFAMIRLLEIEKFLWEIVFSIKVLSPQ